MLDDKHNKAVLKKTVKEFQQIKLEDAIEAHRCTIATNNRTKRTSRQIIRKLEKLARLRDKALFSPKKNLCWKKTILPNQNGPIIGRFLILVTKHQCHYDINIRFSASPQLGQFLRWARYVHQLVFSGFITIFSSTWWQQLQNTSFSLFHKSPAYFSPKKFHYKIVHFLFYRYYRFAQRLTFRPWLTTSTRKP